MYTQCTNPSFTHFRHPSHFEKFEANTAAPARGVNSEILGDKFHSQHSQLVQLCTVLLDLFSVVPENTFCCEPWKHAGSHCFGVKVAVISNRVHPVAPAAQEKYGIWKIWATKWWGFDRKDCICARRTSKNNESSSSTSASGLASEALGGIQDTRFC